MARFPGHVGDEMHPKRSRDSEFQAGFHNALFARLYEWDEVWRAALEMAGDVAGANRLALDQLGHFGPFGVELIAEQLTTHMDGAMRHVLELGSGFGGSLRHMQRLLSARDLHPLLSGIELVGAHCALARTIGQTTSQSGVSFIRADVAELPIRSAAVDAIFCAGSASHFSAMHTTLSECARVLRLGGILVMTEEVSLRPSGAPVPAAAFERHHPSNVFHAASPEERRAQFAAAGLTVLAFTSITPWALPLLRQRVKALRLLGACAQMVFGAGAAERLVDTLDTAATEYERASILPALIVARRQTSDRRSG